MTDRSIVRLQDFATQTRERSEDELLDQVFFALSDPTRRAILARLGEETRLVSELAAPFDVSVQAISRHIQVLVRAGLVQQERTGRISRCSLDAGPIYTASVWMNRYSQYWQEQFGLLAAVLEEIEERKHPPSAQRKQPPAVQRKRRRRTAGRRASR